MPPSLHRVPWVGSPASPVQWGTPTPPRPSLGLRLPSASGTCAPRPSFAPNGRASVTLARPGPNYRWATRTLHAGDEEASQVPGGPMYARPVLRPRSADPPGALSGIGVAYHLNEGVGHDHVSISGLNHAARVLAVYASRLSFPSPVVRPRKTRYRPGASLNRAGLSPAGSLRSVSLNCFPSSDPPFPGFAWRTVSRVRGRR